MSVPVELEALAERIAEFGSAAYLVTINTDEAPRIVAVSVTWGDGALRVEAGRHSLENIDHHANIALLWPGPAGAAYSLIVDGTARASSGAGPPAIEIHPTDALLHRSTEGDPEAPSCIWVLPRP